MRATAPLGRVATRMRRVGLPSLGDARWRLPTGILFAGVAVTYAIGSKCALELAAASGLESVFFIPAGITVAALLRVPRRQWWAVLLAAALAEFVLDVSDGIPVDASAGFVVANVVEPLVGALLVSRWCSGPVDLARRRDVFAFAIGAVFVGPLVGGFLGGASDLAFGDGFFTTWWQWALGDALGVVLVGSGILVWGSSPDRRTLRSVPGVLLLVGALVVTAAAFLVTDLPVTFVVVVGVVIAGILFGARAVAMSALVVAGTIAIGLAGDSSEILVGVADGDALVLIKAQLGVFTLAGLVVAAEAYEAQLATRQAAELENEARYRGTFENAGVGMAHLSPTGVWLRVNDRLCEILGYAREELLGTTYHAVARRDEVAIDADTLRDLAAGVVDDLKVEQQCVRKDGDLVWVSATCSLVRTRTGAPEYFIVVVEDITVRKHAEASLRAQEAAERRARERAELIAEMIERLEAVDGRDARVTRLVELLLERVADYVAVVSRDSGAEVLAVATKDDALQARFGRAHPPTWPEAITVPLELGGDATGTLVLGRSDPTTRPFTDDDLALVDDVAHRAGVILAAARLREEEHRISVRLQRTLLPTRLVSHADVAIAGRYQSGSDLLEVGGDWYDVIARPEGDIVVAVGDVVGQGLDAAATMGRLRAAFAAYTAHTDRPGRLLADLDRFAHGPGGGDFTTLWCGVLDPASGELRYASAGHPPALVVSTDGTVSWLDDGRSVPLCTVPVEHRPDAVRVLRPGDVIVVYTDGLVERRREPLAHGFRRLATATCARKDGSVDEICNGLVEELTDGGHQDDSVVLVLRFTPLDAQRFRTTFPAHADQLARLRSRVRAWLVGGGVDARTANDVLIALGEACANSIEHAYVDGAVGELDVELHREQDDAIGVRVRDRGAWRNSDRDRHRGEDRGRGTPIMRTLTANFARHTGPEGTVVTFQVPVRREERDHREPDRDAAEAESGNAPGDEEEA